MHPKLKVTGALTALALLLTAAFILSWLEMVLAVPMPLPGIKLGLANLAILFTLYYMGIGGALFVLIGRLVLSAALFGNAATLINIGIHMGILTNGHVTAVSIRFATITRTNPGASTNGDTVSTACISRITNSHSTRLICVCSNTCR